MTNISLNLIYAESNGLYLKVALSFVNQTSTILTNLDGPIKPEYRYKSLTTSFNSTAELFKFDKRIS